MSTRWLGIKLFNEQDLEQLAGAARLQRGRRLVDTIEDVYEDEWSICGTVHDGKPYLAMVHYVGDPLSCECDCPEGAPGSWCEHAGAVGLCYLGAGEDRESPRSAWHGGASPRALTRAEREEARQREALGVGEGPS